MEILKNSSVKRIYDYLVSLQDNDLNGKLIEENIGKCFTFVREMAKEKAIDKCAIVDDEEVYGWARHFFDENLFENDKYKTAKVPKQKVAKEIIKKEKTEKVEKVKSYDEVTIFDLLAE